jgi:uncharacterized protein (DUF885 family)
MTPSARPRRRLDPRTLLAVLPLVLTPGADARAATPSSLRGPAPADTLDTGDLLGFTESRMREVVERYREDREAVERRWSVPYSPARRDRLRTFQEGWQARLATVDYDALAVEGRIDWHLLDHELEYARALLDREEERAREMEPVLPFVESVSRRVEGWRGLEDVDPPSAADALVELATRVDSVRRATAEAAEAGRPPVSRVVARRAASVLEGLHRSLEAWYDFYAGYDPLFTWWVEEPWVRVSEAVEAHVEVLREEVAGVREGDEIVGDPIGARGLRVDLEHEMIPYTPAELVEVARDELAWVEAELRSAARAMGHGDDWHAALEEVKGLHREPGGQPALVRELAREAVAFIEERDLVTIPPLAEEVWRWRMMSPERQEVAPFFLGGEVVQIAYPTDAMAHEDKLMSLRGNNVHFSRAVVHHELIPGHHLQGFMTARYNPHRQLFSTPFWGEGWALYWEFLLWDLGFAATPEDRMGMLFWRAHRAARIIFSLSFHLGTMSPEEAVDFLVERVGHERFTAEAEVRRSFAGDYPPLYQAAYMLGGIQIRALRREWVESGRMSDRDFHDRILRGGPMPIEMVRVRLAGELLPRDFTSSWRFAEDPSSPGGR